MTTRYNTTYRVAFPTLMVTLRTDDSSIGPLSALLDTGADFTLIPSSLLDQIEADDIGQVRIETHFGDTHVFNQYLVSIQVNDISLPWVYVVGDDDGDEVILGRDVLNKLPIFLDGPERQTHLLDDATVKRLRTRRPRS